MVDVKWRRGDLMGKALDCATKGCGSDPRFWSSTEKLSPVHPATKWLPVGQLSFCDAGIIIIATLLSSALRSKDDKALYKCKYLY